MAGTGVDEETRGKLRVVVAGPDGRMGKAMMAGLCREVDREVVGALRRDATNRDELLAAADVLVDFTIASSAPALMEEAIRAGVRPVSGTSGIPKSALATIDSLARDHGIGAVWASNFRIGAVLMTHVAELITRYMDPVEIVEAHHAGRPTPRPERHWIWPAGFAAPRIGHPRRRRRARDSPRCARRGDRGVRVHSLRLPGILGWHEVVFTGDDEILTIRHHDLSRESVPAAVAMAAREVVKPGTVGLIRGMEAVLGLSPSA